MLDRAIWIYSSSINTAQGKILKEHTHVRTVWGSKIRLSFIFSPLGTKILCILWKVSDTKLVVLSWVELMKCQKRTISLLIIDSFMQSNFRRSWWTFSSNKCLSAIFHVPIPCASAIGSRFISINECQSNLHSDRVYSAKLNLIFVSAFEFISDLPRVPTIKGLYRKTNFAGSTFAYRALN